MVLTWWYYEGLPEVLYEIYDATATVEMWLFLQLGSHFCGCPCNERPTVLVLPFQIGQESPRILLGLQLPIFASHIHNTAMVSYTSKILGSYLWPLVLSRVAAIEEAAIPQGAYVAVCAPDHRQTCKVKGQGPWQVGKIHVLFCNTCSIGVYRH